MPFEMASRPPTGNLGGLMRSISIMTQRSRDLELQDRIKQEYAGKRPRSLILTIGYTSKELSGAENRCADRASGVSAAAAAMAKARLPFLPLSTKPTSGRPSP